jgi:hypothetical protein
MNHTFGMMFGAGLALLAPCCADERADTATEMAGAHSLPASAASANCPVASCLSRFRALQQTCSLEGLRCNAIRSADRVNYCFDSGARLLLELEYDEPKRYTAIREDDRTCYTIESDVSSTSTVLTVRDVDTKLVLRAVVYQTAGGGVDVACPDGSRLSPGMPHECGDLDLLPALDVCEEGDSACLAL